MMRRINNPWRHVPYALYANELGHTCLFIVDDYGWLVPTSAKQVIVSIS